jgi:hypothetical protein
MTTTVVPRSLFLPDSEANEMDGFLVIRCEPRKTFFGGSQEQNRRESPTDKMIVCVL